MSGDNPDPSRTIRAYLASQILWGVHTAAGHGLNVHEYATLMMAALAGSTTPAQLAAATRLSPAAVSRMVDRLVERGFVARSPDPDDRRRVVITVTPEWGAVARDAAGPHRRANQEVMRGFSEDERRTVLRWMAASTEASLAALDESTGTAAGEDGS